MSDNTYTKADIDKAVKEAVSQVEETLGAKRDELLGEVKALKADLRKHKEIDPGDLTAAEERADKAEASLKTLQAENNKLTTELEKAQKAIESETGFTSKLLVDNGLNDALAKAGVTDPDYLAAAKSMMAGSVQVATEGDERVVRVGDKTLADHVTEWASTDAAKKFISASGNSGGGAHGGKGGGNDNAKTMSRSEYNDKATSDPVGLRSFLKDGGKVVDDAA